MVVSSVNSTSSELCEGPSELARNDQREPVDTNINLQELCYITPPHNCLHSEGNGPLLGADDLFCIRCWGDYLDERLLLDDTQGNTEPEDEKESATYTHTFQSTSLPDRFGGHGGFTLDLRSSEWADSTGKDTPSGLNSTSSGLGDIPGNTGELHTQPLPVIHQNVSEELPVGPHNPPPLPLIHSSEEHDIEAVPGLLHENLKQGAQQGPLDFSNRSLSWNTQEYPEEGVPAWRSERSNHLLLHTAHPDSNHEGNGAEVPQEYKFIVSASPEFPGDPTSRQRTESQVPTILKDEGMTAQIQTWDFNLPLSEINSQETPCPWEKLYPQLNDVPRSSRFLYDTLARNSSLEWGEVEFDDSLVNFRDTSELGNPWRNSQPKGGVKL